MLFEMVESAHVNVASCSETAAFQFETLDVFQSLSALIRMIRDGGDVLETGTCLRSSVCL